MNKQQRELNSREHASESKRWKVYRRGLEIWLVHLLSGLVPMMSRAWLLKCAAGLGNIAFMVDRKGRAVTLGNLEVALGDAMDAEELERIGRRSYQNLARTFLDLLWSPNINAGNLRDVVDFTPNPEMEALRSAGKPFIIAGPHFGHWEFANLLLGYHGVDFMLIVNDIKNAEVDRVVSGLRERSGQLTTRRNGAVLKMLRRLKSGKNVGFLVDQSLRPEHASQVVEFFGLPVCVSTIHAELAQRTGAPIVHVWCYPEADGRYTMVLGKPIYCTPLHSVEEIVQETMKAFEDSIRARPDLFLWNYKHWRYRPVETGRKFPAYANVSNKFDKKLARREAGKVVAANPPARKPQGQREAAAA